MKKSALIILAIVTSFCFGFAFNRMITVQSAGQAEKGRVTGVGGIFFKCKAVT